MDLVITADDLGIDPRRDDGIIEALEQGAVTQASLLVAGPSAKSAAERARRGGWSIGLHLDLTETPACAPKDQIASLLDRGKKLGKHGLRDAIQKIDRAHVALEAEAQIERFAELMGTRPTHVDGHQHVHVVPEITETLATIFQRMDVATVRIPEQQALDTDSAFYRTVSENARAARAIYAHYGIRSSDAFVGLDLMGEASDGARLRDAVSNIAARSVEVMTHPGYVGTGWDDFNESPAREHELRVLLSKPFSSLGLSIVSFRSL
jgi:predicted glycoside hydrolase/deacetylase ChbG (UPF0249 family)